MLQSERVKSASIDPKKIKHDFPILDRKVNGKQLVYLDNAATTQKPKEVIDAITDYYSNYNSNIHRSVHKLAEEATEAFEDARAKVCSFVNASSIKEIIFTRNATEALNIASRCVAERYLRKGDKVVVTEMDHHSNFVPWQQFSKRLGARLEIAKIGKDFRLDEGDLESKIKGARVVAFPHMSNVLGTINDARKITRMAHDEGAIVVVDGAQSAPHMPIDVQAVDCDFFAFSSHKMLGPTGVGCLYAKEKLLSDIPPLIMGGDMIKEVGREETKWNDLPWKFEAGTSNIADVIGFGVALDYLSRLGMANVLSHEVYICREALERLSAIPSLKIYGPVEERKRGAVFSFNVGSAHAHDVASILDSEGVAIRSGHHCAQILMETLNVQATSRASFYVYNDTDDLSALCRGINRVSEVLA
jgi:cysteine desulfurase/selenocysteine lyase